MNAKVKDILRWIGDTILRIILFPIAIIPGLALLAYIVIRSWWEGPYDREE